MWSATRLHKGIFRGTTTWFVEFGDASDSLHIAGTTRIFGWYITHVTHNRDHVRLSFFVVLSFLFFVG